MYARGDVPARPRTHEPALNRRPRPLCTNLTRGISSPATSMRTIQVEAPGLLTTLQDLGRPGYGTLGVSDSGAADPIALRLGNRLVGNQENTAALEMTLLGATFTFSDRMVVALTGSDFGATLDGHVIPLWTSFAVAAGQKL